MLSTTRFAGLLVSVLCWLIPAISAGRPDLPRDYTGGQYKYSWSMDKLVEQLAANSHLKCGDTTGDLWHHACGGIKANDNLELSTILVQTRARLDRVNPRAAYMSMAEEFKATYPLSRVFSGDQQSYFPKADVLGGNALDKRFDGSCPPVNGAGLTALCEPTQGSCGGELGDCAGFGKQCNGWSNTSDGRCPCHGCCLFGLYPGEVGPASTCFRPGYTGNQRPVHDYTCNVCYPGSSQYLYPS